MRDHLSCGRDTSPPRLTDKDKVRALLDRLPDDCSLEDVHGLVVPDVDDASLRELFVYDCRLLYRVHEGRGR